MVWIPDLPAVLQVFDLLKTLPECKDLLNSVCINPKGIKGILDKVEFTQYIMGYYNSSSGLFMDNYAYRYLDTDFNHIYYPLSTVLEVNCYALLSLSFLDGLSLINTSASIDFLWSCYNPCVHFCFWNAGNYTCKINYKLCR